ncbi:hypothetical protein B7494_g5429 [Chlorociboria aeruginascens]|nr:hypothetical protein B7494_g5429 [Chlorociboria aeruginascens]
MPSPWLPLLTKNITLEEALDEDDDILSELSYPENRVTFYLTLSDHRREIEAIVSFHLGVPKDACKVAEDYKEWVQGSFNACIPVYIDDSAKFPVKKVFIRFPLLYKVGELQCPGNAEEKLRSEVATYIWIQSNCPDIPIPCLRGFGFPGGWSFTNPENAPRWNRISWCFRRMASWLFRSSVPSRYVGRQSPYDIGFGYLIVDAVEKGEMLSLSWKTQQNDRDRRTNLFKDLSRFMLSLDRSPFPRIGSLTINDQGIVSLTNRPLTYTMQQLENLGVPTGIPRDRTYSSVDMYLLDTLAYHDNRMRHMPNSVHNTQDGQGQLSALTIMRALLRSLTNPDLRYGPFVLTLTDTHPSNIFVDSDWHITAMIDLEWACARPIEMQYPPFWLTSKPLTSRCGEDLEAFNSLRLEFLDAFQAEERLLGKADTPYTRIMQKGWEIGSYWYLTALDYPDKLYGIYLSQIIERFAKLEDGTDEFDRTVSAYWSTGAVEFIAAKVKDKELYSSRLRQRFSVEVEDLER